MYNGVGAMPPMNDYGMIMYGSCYNTWGARKFHSTVWFCCQGSFLQTVNDYHDLIYFKDSKNLYVNLFVPSEVDWDSPDGKITLRQETKFPESNRMTYTVKAAQSSRFGLKFRVPLWSKKGMTFDVNGEPVKVSGRKLSVSGRIRILLPLKLTCIFGLNLRRLRFLLWRRCTGPL